MINLSRITHRPRVPLRMVYPSASEISAGFFDPRYTNHPIFGGKQHLGTDIRAMSGADVLSPVTGTLVERKIFDDPYKSFIVIQCAYTRIFHVLGHVSDETSGKSNVSQGQPIGKVRLAGSGSHLHWGTNIKSDLGRGFTKDGEWGWGRAPIVATQKEGEARGWLDPMSLLFMPSMQSMVPYCRI